MLEGLLSDSFESNPEIIKNYDLLKQTGVIDQLQNLQNDIQVLKQLLQDTKEVFNQNNTVDLMECVSKILLYKFLPSYLAFIFEKETSLSDIEIVCYKDMKKVENLIHIPTLEPYKHFFSLSPMSVTFKVFEYMVNRPNLTDVFKPLKPSLMIPVLGFNRVYGFIVVGERMVGGDFSRKEIEYINILMQFISISFQNNINYTRAILDFKTRLYNHSFLMTRFEEELSRLKRYGLEMAIMILDVDHFKRFNDTYGHLAGDKVLEAIARVLKNSIRKGDIAGRFGGEEFIAILPHCTKDSAWIVSERIRHKVSKIRIKRGGDSIQVTVSLGIRHITDQDKINSAVLLDEADRALYQSKVQGRNRSTFFKKAES